MKVSKQKMAEHREQIIVAAAQKFREKGFDGISVADLMKQAGLTHGAFYGHFNSKEELMAMASQRALQDSVKRYAKTVDDSPDKPLMALAKLYLSPRHQAHPETGCVFAALGSELARQPASVKDAVAQEGLNLIELISRIVPGRTKAARKKRAIAVFAELVGAMILARSTPDANLSQEILATVSDSVASAGK
jgi:TetR/AcrR family transcriptional repressor of nem operon